MDLRIDMIGLAVWWLVLNMNYKSSDIGKSNTFSIICDCLVLIMWIVYIIKDIIALF